MEQDIKITLQGVPYQVSPLKVKQARMVLPQLSKAGGCFDTTEAYDNVMSIIFHALNDSYPQVNEESLQEMVITPTEILIAVGAIMKASGLQEADKAVKLGEALAAKAAEKAKT